MPNRSARIAMIDALEKKVLIVKSFCSAAAAMISIDILTNLSIKTSTRYYRKSSVSKQKARSRSWYILLSSKVFIQAIAKVYLKLLRAQQGQTAPCSGILRWAGGACGVDDDWRTRVDCTETGCRAPLLFNTGTRKWRKVCRYLSSETIEL